MKSGLLRNVKMFAMAAFFLFVGIARTGTAEAAPPLKNADLTKNIIVNDSADKTIGEVVGIRHRILHEAYVALQPTYTNGDSSVVALISAKRIRGTGYVMYEGLGCMGTAWIVPEANEPPEEGNLFPYTGIGPSGSAMLLYKASSDTLQPIVVGSVYSRDELLCRDGNGGAGSLSYLLQGFRAVPVTELGQFLPPFKMMNP